MATPQSLTSELMQRLAGAITAHGGSIGFEQFMEMALYTPGLGYYASGRRTFGRLPARDGSDFVTAPEMTPFFGRAFANQLAQALQVTATNDLWEFGAGSGALAEQLLRALGEQVRRYTIVDVSGALQQRQRERLQAFGDRVRWLGELPDSMQGVVLGNELLDAMPVRLLARQQGVWHERGVALSPQAGLVWQDRLTDQRPPLEIAGDQDYLTEIHSQAEGFMRALADRLERGAAFFIDNGFPEREYYHPQRSMGTLMCHRAHRMDGDPLCDIGLKDITAHVNFTGLAVAAQEAGLGVLGYTSQARFLMNCGLLPLLEGASVQERVMAQKLLMEHEMGELFKVIGFHAGEPWPAIGFAQGDRSHAL
ncbi:MAG: SAM-dependent methyltransferase [Rhodoferax sp.]|nr:SAM-dependent methyltransferase [Rhodoferax sp.]